MKNTPTLNWKGDEYYRRHPSRKKLRDSCIERVDWTALRQYASSKHSSHPCSLLDESTLGGIHLIRLLDFGDTQWIARVQLEPSTQESASILQAEIHAMELIRARSAIPMPEIFGYELNDNNSVGAAFVLMEFLPGSSAMDAAGGYEVHHGQIPLERRSGFYEEMARIQVSATRYSTGSTIHAE